MKIKPYLVLNNYNLGQALKIMNKNGRKCCVVVDKYNHLVGTLSDGDIRKVILKRSNLKVSVMQFCNKKPAYVTEGNYSDFQIKQLFLKGKYDLIPVIDKKKIVKNVLLWHVFFDVKKKPEKRVDAKVVIMAGGKGSRLDPLTRILPKPLVPINNQAIIEHITNRFLKYGITDFFFTIRYKMKIIKAYFSDSKINYKIRYLEEKKPLGTAGGLQKLVGKIKSSFFVTNCDVLINVDLASFFDFHKNKKLDISLITSSQKYTVPYGVCELNKNGKLKKITEKPKLNYFVNAGMYLIEPKVLKLIPKNKYFDMNNLIQKAIKKKYNVGVYPIGEKDWVDIGQLEEYKKHLKII